MPEFSNRALDMTIILLHTASSEIVNTALINVVYQNKCMYDETFLDNKKQIKHKYKRSYMHLFVVQRCARDFEQGFVYEKHFIL